MFTIHQLLDAYARSKEPDTYAEWYFDPDTPSFPGVTVQVGDLKAIEDPDLNWNHDRVPERKDLEADRAVWEFEILVDHSDGDGGRAQSRMVCHITATDIWYVDDQLTFELDAEIVEDPAGVANPFYPEEGRALSSFYDLLTSNGSVTHYKILMDCIDFLNDKEEEATAAAQAA